MKKLFTLLIMAILATATSWAAVVSGTTYNTPSLSGLPEGWEGSGNGTSYVQLVAANHYIQTSTFEQNGFTSVKLKARKYGGPTDAQAKITVSWYNSSNVETVLGTINPTSTTLTDYTISSPASVAAGSGYVKIQCKGAGSSKGSGVSAVTLEFNSASTKTLTSLAVSGTPTKTTYNEGDTFNPAGLTVTGTYSDGNTAPITSGITWTFNPATLSVGQTSVNVTAKVGDVTSPSYTVNGLTVNGLTALTTMDEIFAAATSAGATATDTKVTFNNWVVTGVKNSNAYVTDGTKGFIIYASGHGFEVGDVLSGTVNCKVQLFKGSSELTNLTSTTSGLTVTKGGTATPQTIDIADLSGVNTGAVLKFSNVTYNGTAFSDGTNTITPYNTFMTLPTLTSGVKYNVTGVFILFDGTKEIAPRTSEDIEEVQAVKYNVTIADGIANGTVSADPAEAPEGATVTLNATPAAGYQFGTWDVKDASNNPITVTDNKFTMPAANVTVSATFVEIPKFTVTIASGIANGTVSADVAEAPEGAEVTLTATPAEGYKFGAWDVKDASNNSIEVANNKFTMPAANVTVSATFVEKQATSAFVLVTNADQLAEGKKIVFVGKKDSDFYSMGTNSTANNRPAVTIEVENNEAYPSEDVQVFTLEATTNTADDATWMFNDGNDQYIYAAGGAGSSPKNYLKTASATTAGDNGKATISVNPDGGADVVFTGTSVRNIIKFNSTNNPPIFSCYGSGQSPVYIYISDEAPATKTLDHITLSGTYQTAFNVGDTFNHEGMTVTASYAEEGVADADVTKQATFSTPDMSQAGTQAVTVSYTEKGVTKTATYDITLTEITKYAVNIAEMTNGSVTASPAPAAEGQIVTLTVTPAAHYHISALTVTGASGEVTVTSNKFTMPAEDVTVSATFEEDAKYTYTWYVNGQVLKTVNAYEGADIEAPNNPATPAALTGKVFTGWVTTSTVDALVEPTYVTVDTKATATTSYYAVFATKTGTGSAGYQKVTEFPEYPAAGSADYDSKLETYLNRWKSGDYLLVHEDGSHYQIYNGLASVSGTPNYVDGGAYQEVDGNKVISKDAAQNAAVIKFVQSSANNTLWIKLKEQKDGKNYYVSTNGGGNGLVLVDDDNVASTYNKAKIEFIDGKCFVSATGKTYTVNRNDYTDLNLVFTGTDYGIRFMKLNSSGYQGTPIWVYEKTEGASYSEWTTGEVPAAVTMTGTYRSKFVGRKDNGAIVLKNLYKNTIKVEGLEANQTYTVNRKANNGDEQVKVASVTVDANGNYSVEYENEISVENDQYARYDGDDYLKDGVISDGVLISDYFNVSTSTAEGGDRAGKYIYTIAEVPNATPFEVPVYAAHASGQLRVSKDQAGYTYADILADNPANINTTLALPKVMAITLDQVSAGYLEKTEVYRNNAVVGTLTTDNPTLYIEGIEPRNSNTFVCNLYVMSPDNVMNTYGTNQGTASAMNVTAEAIDKEKSKYVFNYQGENAHYYSFNLQTTISENNAGEWECVGIRAFRTVTNPAEEYKELLGRADNFFMYYNTVSDVPTPINGTQFVIGSEEIKNATVTPISNPSIKKTVSYTTGTFGSADDQPTVQSRVRCYYRKKVANEGGQNAPAKAESTEPITYFVSENFNEPEMPNNPTTGILDVFGAKEVKSVRYFNIMGVESAEPVDGVNIVVTTYTDGTSSSAKMLR